jgi:hypothetical protein
MHSVAPAKMIPIEMDEGSNAFLHVANNSLVAGVGALQRQAVLAGMGDEAEADSYMAKVPGGGMTNKKALQVSCTFTS